MRKPVRTLAVAGSLAAVVLGAGFSIPAVADPAADIKYRQGVMKASGDHMGAAAAIIRGRAGDKSHLAGHAEAIAAIGRIVGDLFPAGSGQGNTAALPAIWEKPDDFRKAAQAFTDTSAKLAAAAKSGDMDAVKAAFGGVGKSCGGCHGPFRKKK